MTLEQIKEKYEDRILAILKKIASAFNKDASYFGYATDAPQDMSSDIYKWAFALHVDGNIENFGEKDIDCQITILESEFWDGDENGVNFMLEIAESGGLILGKCSPYNYTEEVWVDRDNEAAVEERFKIFEAALADPTEVVKLINDHLRTHNGELLIENPISEKGYDGYHNQLKKSDNPYGEGTGNFDLWEAGWLRADCDTDCD